MTHGALGASRRPVETAISMTMAYTSKIYCYKMNPVLAMDLSQRAYKAILRMVIMVIVKLWKSGFAIRLRIMVQS